MQDDKTVIKAVGQPDEFATDGTVLFKPMRLQVVVNDEAQPGTSEYSFSGGFSVGRSADNDIVLDNKKISRHHFDVREEQGNWWIYDLNSANGVFIHGQPIKQKAKLHLPVSITLGKSATSILICDSLRRDELATQIIDSLHLDEAFTELGKQKTLSKDEIKARYLTKDDIKDAGEFTQLFRTLIREDRVSRGKNYKTGIAVLAVLFAVVAGWAGYQQMALKNARKLAIDMFYDIKTLEVSMSQSEIMIEKSAAVMDEAIKSLAKEKNLQAEQALLQAQQEKIEAENRRLAMERVRLKAMKSKYRDYVKQADSLRFRLPFGSRREEELITKVAREFGESELELPDGFVAEVKKYIQYWQNSPRMANAIATLEKNNYAPIILSALEKENLPLQFMYLPMQESNYNTLAIGPETRFGIAKGAWQFIPSTGKDYGLNAGPLQHTREIDDKDDRFNFKLASRAGARYLKFIFGTEAQASGLLVMASYNYGDYRVRNMIKRMPDNPKDKNFWKFINQYKIPKETYDYVFYIFAAAVIGEDPAYFGFKFKSPLGDYAVKNNVDALW